MARLCSCAGVVAVVAGLLCLEPPEARAEDEVRIAVGPAKRTIRIQAENLVIFDGEFGERLAAARGATTVIATATAKAVRIEGRGLKKRRKELVGPRFVIEAPGGIRVDGTLYLGRVVIRSDKARHRIRAVNRLPIETYLLGIVGSEMSPSWPAAALKAQAVAARTYAVHRRQMMRAADRPYDLESTVLSQVYKGAERIRPSVERAVFSTRGQVLSYEHMLVEALFHSTCGGHTLSAQQVFGRPVDYLKSQRCTWCKPSSRYRWDANFGLRDLEKRLKKAALMKGRLEHVERDKRDASVTIRSAGKKKALKPAKLRRAVGYSKLFSSRFTAETRGSTIRFRGMGFGHGVGLCQWGAHGMASEGFSYLDILGHYYKGARVKRIY